MENTYVPKKSVIYSASVISTAVKKLGKKISEDYKGRELILVFNLNGVFIFASDLYREIDLDAVGVTFVQTSKYPERSIDQHDVSIEKRVDQAVVKGKNVMLVDSIIDTGVSMSVLEPHIMSASPRTLTKCVLVNKHGRREKNVTIQYEAFTVETGYLVGYGLGVGDKFRACKDISVLDAWDR